MAEQYTTVMGPDWEVIETTPVRQWAVRRVRDGRIVLVTADVQVANHEALMLNRTEPGTNYSLDRPPRPSLSPADAADKENNG